MKSLYIHIPFCKKKCIYCDFYSEIYNFEKASKFIEVICWQIRKIREKNFETIYIGGGTPSVLELLERLLKELYPLIKKAKEVSIEVNPESIDEEKIELLKDFVNRISIGVQSFNDKKLKALTRMHDAKKSIESILNLSKRFKNLSIDLIFGIWNEKIEDFKKDLETATQFPLTHISVYNLTYEKNTPLYELKEKGKIIPLDNEIEAKMYELCLKFLPKKKFYQYEISNFSKKGFECLHNLNYWNMGEFLGLGPGAASFLDKVYYRNYTPLESYIKRVKKNERFFFVEKKLTSKQKIKYKVILNFRRIRKIRISKEEQKVLKRALNYLIKEKYVKVKENGNFKEFSLTKKGIFFYDELAKSILLC